MTPAIPPELLSPEERTIRAAELERQMGRAWLRFVIVETLLISIPVVAFLIVSYATDAIPDGIRIQVLIGAGILYGVFVALYITRRIQPLQRELANLRRFEGID